MKLNGKIAFISGASAGIGKAIAETFAEAGANLILSARRIEKLKVLAEDLHSNFGTETQLIELDVRNFDKVESAIKNLRSTWANIDILVNNAGKAKGFDKIHQGSLIHWEEMIDTNVKGLLYLSRLILPGMVERASGHVVNIGSIAGVEVYPSGNVYCASKFAVHAISKGMVIDLNGTGVKVTNIAPGLVETEFAEVRFDGDKERGEKVYEGYKPLEAQDIADIALFAVTRKHHVQIQEILVTPLDQATATIVNKKL
jgi:3-hydroxy acid dehydrogenase/malonic semialdehyde reductase